MFDRTCAGNDNGVGPGFIQGASLYFSKRRRADQQMRLVAEERTRLTGPLADADNARSLGDQHRFVQILRKRKFAERALKLIMSGLEPFPEQRPGHLIRRKLILSEEDNHLD